MSFEESIQNLPFEEFSKAVNDGGDYLGQKQLEKQLRAHIVREKWEHEKERTTKYWRGKSPENALLPTLLLERLIDGVLEGGRRTHIASRRESLCSSWPAALESLDRSPLPLSEQRWMEAFKAAISGQAALNDPKLTTTVDELVKLIRRNVKVVVFTQRLATSHALAQLLDKHPELLKIRSEMRLRAKRLRRHVGKIADWLGLDNVAYATGVVKVMAHSPDCPKMELGAVRNWWRRHRKMLGGSDLSDLAGAWGYLQPILGHGRQLPVVVRHDADTGSDERNLGKFNLPSLPLVLIATPKAQEGIDLHHYCRHVVLFDLTWNPAAMEQRIGRVHRLGGNRRANEKVTVVYCFQKGTYEAEMAKVVQKRCEMMRVLLGAGQWLDEDRDVKDFERYSMTFPAQLP